MAGGWRDTTARTDSRSREPRPTARRSWSIRDADSLYQVLEQEVIPTYYERDQNELRASGLR